MKDPMMEFIDASLERDLGNLDLETQLGALLRVFSAEHPGLSTTVEIIGKTLRMVGPELYRSGYLAGARTGMEVGQVILKEEMPK